MKGVIYKYLPKEGYGFILDENDQSRFFHINDVIDKEKLLQNLEEFRYHGKLDNQCFILDFTPSENQGGKPKAIRINLTDELLNKKIPGAIFEARIDDIKYDVQVISKIVQGIKKGQSAPPFATAGSNGTYRLDYPEVLRDLIIDFTITDNIGWGIVLARETALIVNKRSKITTPFVNALRSKLKGKTVNIVAIDKSWRLEDPTILKL